MFVGDYVRLCQLHNKVISELPENIKIKEAEEKAKREYEGLKKREDKNKIRKIFKREIL